MKKLTLLFFIMSKIAIAQPPQVSGFQEVVFSVYDLKQQTKFYTEVAGWKVIHKAKNQTLKIYENLSFDEVLLQNEGDSLGFVRLIKFKNVEQKVIRSGAKAWDNGGIFDVDLRVKNIEEKFSEAEKQGYNITTKPILYDFGKFKVKEGLLKGPDGIELAVIQRIEPPLVGWETMIEFSRVFNSSQIVNDIEKSADFYINQLGFKVYMKSFEKGKESVNLFGIPQNFNPKTEHKVLIVSPDGTNNGSVELIEISGVKKEDFSEFAKPPHRGILTLRFPVKDIEAFTKNLCAKFVEIEIQPTLTSLKPYGKVKMMVLRSPDGAWLEFFEKL